ncbi:hypothetical protein [Micromonospora sp. NPDC005806]|uniref:hypothetical protein n=1 Tax=Micromonospora sp. NPDC005806 TaxID=3364234 RepID=UPI0036B19BA6
MLRRRLPLTLLSLLIVTTVAACGGESAPQAAHWSAPPTPTVTPPPPLKPAPTTAAQVRSRVKTAMLDLDSEFHPETTEFTEENSDAWKLISLCRDALPSDRRRTAYRERIWDGETIWVRQYVVGYLKVPGRKLADELQGVLKTCKQYKVPGDGRTSEIVRPSPPPVANGPDVITFCEKLIGRSTRHQCTLLVARGNFVLQVDVAGKDGDLTVGTELLARIAPLATAALEQAT